MLIKNITKKRIIAENAVLCNDLTKYIGLMFSFKQKNSLVFRFDNEQNIALHMFFVFYPIDVLFLDKNKTVVDMKENFRPFTAYVSKKKAIYAVELPSGAVKITKTQIGDEIGF